MICHNPTGCLAALLLLVLSVDFSAAVFSFISPHLQHLPYDYMLPTLEVDQRLFMATAVAYHPDDTRLRQPLDLHALQPLAVALNSKRRETVLAAIHQRPSTIKGSKKVLSSTSATVVPERVVANAIAAANTSAQPQPPPEAIGSLNGLGRLLPAQEAAVTIISPEELQCLQKAGVAKKEVDDIAYNYYIVETEFKPICLVREALPSVPAKSNELLQKEGNEVWYIKLESRQWLRIRKAVGDLLNDKVGKSHGAADNKNSTSTNDVKAIFNSTNFQPHLLVAATQWSPGLDERVGRGEQHCTANLRVVNFT